MKLQLITKMFKIYSFQLEARQLCNWESNRNWFWNAACTKREWRERSSTFILALIVVYRVNFYVKGNPTNRGFPICHGFGFYLFSYCDTIVNSSSPSFERIGIRSAVILKIPANSRMSVGREDYTPRASISLLKIIVIPPGGREKRVVPSHYVFPVRRDILVNAGRRFMPGKFDLTWNVIRFCTGSLPRERLKEIQRSGWT